MDTMPEVNPARISAIANTVLYYLKEAGTVLLAIVALPLLILLTFVFGTDIVIAFLSRLPSGKRSKAGVT